VLANGDVLGDRYRLDGPVAGGGMGEVWRATDLELSRTVAVKVLRQSLGDPSFAARFRAEARTMAALNHPHVANVYDYGRDDHATYLVMAFVDGQPLSERIASAGRLSPDETMAIVAQAADALEAAHRLGIVHRDVKPANLLISDHGTVTLVDFGIARSVTATTALTTGHNVLGTALYMAPEQASGGTVGPAADVYALGAVAYHALAGHPPYPGDNALEVALKHLYDEPAPLPDDVPPRVRALVERAMARDPADRYPSAGAMAVAASAAPQPLGAPRTLGAAQTLGAQTSDPADTLPVPVLVPAPVRTPTRRRGLNRGGLLALVAAVLVLLAGLGLLALVTANGAPGTGPTHSPLTTSVAPSSPAQGPAGGGPTGRPTTPGRTSSSAPAPASSAAAPPPPPPSPTAAPSSPSAAPSVAPSSVGAAASSAPIRN
jgi:eukaryotic-like serine/threonine-protein kinase